MSTRFLIGATNVSKKIMVKLIVFFKGFQSINNNSV